MFDLCYAGVCVLGQGSKLINGVSDNGSDYRSGEWFAMKTTPVLICAAGGDLGAGSLVPAWLNTCGP